MYIYDQRKGFVDKVNISLKTVNDQQIVYFDNFICRIEITEVSLNMHGYAQLLRL